MRLIALIGGLVLQLSRHLLSILSIAILISTLVLGQVKPRSAQGVQLNLVFESNIVLDYTWQWTANSQTFWLKVGNSFADANVVTYNLENKSINTIAASAWQPAPSLSSTEVNFFSPYVQTDDKGNR